MKHKIYKPITLIRHTDMKVYGTYRSVEKISFKDYRIKDGQVQVKFCGKWMEIREYNEGSTDNVRKMHDESEYESLRDMAVSARCELIWG